MNFSNYRFTLDLHSLHSQTSIPVMLGDTGITWHINLCDGGKPYLIADGCLAKISIKRPTGTYHEAFCEIRENATIVYPFEQETCVAVGLHNCEITLYGVDGTVLGTPRFSMVVGDRVIRNDDINLTDQDRTIVDAMAVEEAKRQAAEESRAARFEQTIEDMKETFRNSAVHIGPEAPENGETIWLDTNEEEKSEIGVVAKVGQVLAVKSIGPDGKPAEYYGVDLPKVPTPNMDANEGEEGYVEGRTHYVDKDGIVHKLDNKYIDAAWMATKEENGGTIEWWQDLAFTSAYFFLNPHWYPDVGFDWDIYWNNTKYTCPLVTSAGECFLGNRSLLGSEYPDTGEPFLFYGYALTNKDPEIVALKKKTETAETVNVVITTKHEVVYNTLPKEYLPPDMGNGTGVDSHNVNAEAHNDIRLLIAGLNTRLNTLANSEDVNLDQLAELVAYIKSNRTLIEQVTTNKVSVSDIINNLTTNVSNKPLSAAQGVALKALIDAITVPTKLAEMEEDETHRTVSDEEKTKWNESGIDKWDEVKAYIANDSIVISEQTISSGMWSKRQMDIQLEIPYAVYINGTVYFCIAGEEDGGYYLGNPTLFYSKSTQPHNNEPFCIYCAGGKATSGFFYKDDTLSYPLTLKVNSATVTTEKKLPKSYLPDDVALKSDIPEGGSGANIDVVASVGQTIVVEEVDADGKPTKWKAADYQPRTHWSEEGKVQVSYQPKYQSELNSEYGFYEFLVHFNEYVESYPLTSIYSIEYDGVEYKNLATVELQGTRFFGNLYFLNSLYGTSFENTGEPFLLTGGSHGMSMFTLDQQASTHSVQIYVDGTNHHRIDQCYIPKLPVVDLTPYYMDIEFNKRLTITGDDYFEKVYEVLRKYEIVRIVYRSSGGGVVTGCGFPMRIQASNIFVHCIGNKDGCINLNVDAAPTKAIITVVQ